MYHPTTRLLTILELLQAHGEMTGRDLSRRLEVDPRTIRRYITQLQDMGIPIEAERGRSGAYCLRRGFKLPPLMFTTDEAFAVALSLRVARLTALSGSGMTLEGAAAKIERVLPENIREQVQDVLDTLSIQLNVVPGVTTAADIIQAASTACRHHRQILLRHTAHDQVTTERRVDPYGVAYRLGRWYLVGFCHLREEMRTFRLDRVGSIQVLDAAFEPQHIDVLDHVERALALTPGIYHVEVIFDANVETMRKYVPVALGQLTALENQQSRLACFVQSLTWCAGMLASIPVPQSIVRPPELLQEMQHLAQWIGDTVSRST